MAFAIHDPSYKYVVDTLAEPANGKFDESNIRCGILTKL